MINAIPPGDPKRTHIIGRSQGYLGLAVNFGTEVDVTNGLEVPALTTAYTPTPEELAKLNAGGSVAFQFLYLTQHPPCKVWVTDAPEGV
jgi:hypothetical protein